MWLLMFVNLYVSQNKIEVRKVIAETVCQRLAKELNDIILEDDNRNFYCQEAK